MQQLSRPRRILVVEGDEETRSLLARTLREQGYQLAVAGNGWTAAAAVREMLPDLVLLDVLLPLGEGWFVLELLRQLPIPPRIIVVTKLGDEESFARAVHEGATGYIFKPFHMADLVAMCDRALYYESPVASSLYERRGGERRLLVLGLTAQRPLHADVAPAWLVDVSLTGARLDSPAPLEPGEPVRLTVQLPDENAPLLSLDGRVQWRGGSGRRFAHGVIFDDVTPETQQHLRELLAS